MGKPIAPRRNTARPSGYALCAYAASSGLARSSLCPTIYNYSQDNSQWTYHPGVQRKAQAPGHRTYRAVPDSPTISRMRQKRIDEIKFKKKCNNAIFDGIINYEGMGLPFL